MRHEADFLATVSILAVIPPKGLETLAWLFCVAVMIWFIRSL